MWFLIVAAVVALSILHARVGVSVLATVAHVSVLVLWVGVCGIAGAVLGGVDAGPDGNPFPALFLALQVVGLAVSAFAVLLRLRGRRIRYGR